MYIEGGYDAGPTLADKKVSKAVASAGAGVSIIAPPAVDTVEEQRKYIGRRALDVIEDKILALRERFKIDFHYRPKTAQEALKRIKDGEFTIEGADKKDPTPYRYLEGHFSWRGPKDQADKEGFVLARDEFVKFYVPLLDEIRIFDPKDGLESLRKLEAYSVD